MSQDTFVELRVQRQVLVEPHEFLISAYVRIKIVNEIIKFRCITVVQSVKIKKNLVDDFFLKDVIKLCRDTFSENISIGFTLSAQSKDSGEGKI